MPACLPGSPTQNLSLEFTGELRGEQKWILGLEVHSHAPEGQPGYAGTKGPWDIASELMSLSLTCTMGWRLPLLLGDIGPNLILL